MIEINNIKNSAININNNSLINSNLLDNEKNCSHDEHKTHLIRWINIFCSQLQFSAFSRLMIIVLVTLSNNRNKFKATYAIIEKQISKIEDKNENINERKVNKQIVRRRLKMLKKEQQQKGFSFFTWILGSQVKEGNELINIATEFEEQFYLYFKQDLDLVRKEAHNYNNFFAAMDEIFLREINKRIASLTPQTNSEAEKCSPEKNLITKSTVFQKADNLYQTILLFEEKFLPLLSKEEIEKTKINALQPILKNILTPDNLDSFKSLIQDLEKEKTDLKNQNKNDTYSYDHEKREEEREREKERGIMHDTPIEKTQNLLIKDIESELIDLDLRCIKCGAYIIDVLEAEEEICFNCQDNTSFETTAFQEVVISRNMLLEESFEDQAGELGLESCKGCKILSLLEKNGFCESCSSMLRESQQMIMLFDSVGVKAIDFNMIAYDPNHIRGIGKSLEYIRNCSPDEIINHINNKISLNFEEKAHLFFRPRNLEGILLIQLDDITEETINLLKDKAFLTINTSSNNFQCWVAVKAEKKNFAVIKESFLSFLEKFDKVDRGATNSIRACSKNLKPKYFPNFPKVNIFTTNFGKVLDIEELEALGIKIDFSLVEKEKSNIKKCDKKPEEKKIYFSSLSSSSFREYSSLLLTEVVTPFPENWKKKEYEFFLEKAKYKAGTNEKDLSGVDFGYTCQKLIEGLTPVAVEEDLKKRSLARGKSYSYAFLTVRKAQDELVRAGKLKVISVV